MSKKNIITVNIPLDHSKKTQLKILSAYTGVTIRNQIAKWVNAGMEKDMRKVPELIK